MMHTGRTFCCRIKWHGTNLTAVLISQCYFKQRKEEKHILGKNERRNTIIHLFHGSNGLLGTFIRGLKWLNLVKSCLAFEFLFFFFLQQRKWSRLVRMRPKGFSLTFWLFTLNGNSSWSSHADFNGDTRIPKNLYVWLVRVVLLSHYFLRFKIVSLPHLQIDMKHLRL